MTVDFQSIIYLSDRIWLPYLSNYSFPKGGKQVNAKFEHFYAKAGERRTLMTQNLKGPQYKGLYHFSLPL